MDPALRRDCAANKARLKADMLTTVSFSRLDLFRTGRDFEGKRKYLNIEVSDAQFAEIRVAMLHGLGMAHLTRGRL